MTNAPLESLSSVRMAGRSTFCAHACPRVRRLLAYRRTRTCPCSVYGVPRHATERSNKRTYEVGCKRCVEIIAQIICLLPRVVRIEEIEKWEALTDHGAETISAAEQEENEKQSVITHHSCKELIVRSPMSPFVLLFGAIKFPRSSRAKYQRLLRMGLVPPPTSSASGGYARVEFIFVADDRSSLHFSRHYFGLLRFKYYPHDKPSNFFCFRLLRGGVRTDESLGYR